MALALEILLLGIGMISCMVMLYQDVRRRWIHAVPVATLWLSGLGYGWMARGADMATDLIGITLFLSLILGIAWVLMRLRHPGVNLTDAHLGWGDILFFFAMMGWFDLLGYAIFFVSGLLVVLGGIGFLVWRGIWTMDRSIPLAGCLAGYALVFAPVYFRFEDLLLTWLLV